MASSNDSSLEIAVQAVKRGEISIGKAAILYECERNKIWRRVHNKTVHNHSGRLCVLNAQEEKEIVRCCQVLGEIGVCADRNVVGTVVKDYLQALGRSSPFEDGVPGRRWWQIFFKRWPELSLKGYWNI